MPTVNLYTPRAAYLVLNITFKKKGDVTSSMLTPQSTPQQVLKCIEKEVAVLECTEQRSSCLEKVHQALRSLPPSSTEAERSFSAARLLITKLRTRLNDDTIGALFFLCCLLLEETKGCNSKNVTESLNLCPHLGDGVSSTRPESQIVRVIFFLEHFDSRAEFQRLHHQGVTRD